MIGRSGKRGSGISVLAARHDDDTNNSNCCPDHGYYNYILASLLSKALVWFGWVLWHINYCRLFNAKYSIHIY